MAGLADIPAPSALPLIGHAHLIQPGKLISSLKQIASQFDGIFRLRFPGADQVFVSTQALVNEVCDEKRFEKKVAFVVETLRYGLHDGLFTARNDEEAWGIAHRVLTPAFGPFKIRDMFEEMHEVSTQLALKWARAGPNADLHVADDFTRLTLDTIALCSMGFRFNSFYTAEMHPFVQAMTAFLTEAGDKGTRILPSVFYRAQDQKWAADGEILRSTAQKVLDSRKNGESTRDNDLLAAMMKGVDPDTGKQVSDEGIIDNLITFLIAGHETTSGMLSYTFYHLLKNPETFAKAQQEVDSVCGKDPITLGHLSKLPYINGALREALRIDSTIPAMGLAAKEDTVIGGKYFIPKGQTMVCLVTLSNRDPSVYGEDSQEFKPERMMDDNFNRLSREFPSSWKPFGNGKRACIGRGFAWQEALITMAVLLQNFNFTLNPDYTLAHKEALTLKPDGMRMRATLRDNLTPAKLERRLAGSALEAQGPASDAAVLPADQTKGFPLTVLYGSNTGTCKALAQQAVSNAAAHGFRAIKLDSLDSAKADGLPKNHPVVIITASFEGEPPDNTCKFISWIESLNEGAKEMENVSYVVFGCGNSEWVSTYHKIPKLVDRRLAALGAKRLVERGLSDVSTGATFTEFEVWENTALWPALQARYGASKSTAQGLKVVVSNPRSTALQQDVQEAIVVKTKTLTKTTNEKWKKQHMEVKLPEGMNYDTGDYLAVLPVNPKETVQRAMWALGLAWDARFEITSDVPVPFPVKTSMLASDILTSYVELAQPATEKDIQKLAEIATDGNTLKSLNHLAGDGFTNEISDKKVSVLGLLERFPCLHIPVEVFLFMLPAMNVRRYSISSSPLEKPGHATVTFSILREPSLSGQGLHIGVATSYLTSLKENDALQVAIRPSPTALSLPTSPEKTPLLLVGAGAGLAPFRAFIQERAHMIADGNKLAPAILFFGCRSPDVDDLYREEFDEWQRLGAVDMRRAYSGAIRPENEGHGCRYVQDRMWHDREDIADLWKQGAKLIVCGSKAVGDSVKGAIIQMKKEGYLEEGTQDEYKLQVWFRSLRNVRYVEDIFD